MKVHLDFETRSCADIKKTGSVRYAMDPTTRVLCAAYQIDDGPVRLWVASDSPFDAPVDLLEAVAGGATVCAHNALFELSIWTYFCEPKLGWPKLSPYQMDCTMARAHVMSLIGSLDGASRLLGVGQEKDKEGHAVMMRLCRPRKPRKGESDLAVLWNDDPADFQKLYAYCMQDVRVEVALDKVLPQLSEREREVYHFDLTVNLRGFRLDTDLMRRADAVLDEAKIRINQRIAKLTDGAVTAATQVTALRAWLATRGITVDSLKRGDLEDITEHARLFDDAAAEEVVMLRRLGAKATSLAKYASGLRCAGPDERARGLLTYHKASTGRWAGSLYQPHNLERIDPEKDAGIVESMLDVLQRGLTPRDACDWLEFLGIEPMLALGKATRAMIVAAPGHELIGCDYSNVEGRGSAWLAREEWKLQAFRDYDTLLWNADGTPVVDAKGEQQRLGPDLYKVSYSRSFGVPVEKVDKSQRQIGKVQELASGYQGSVGAYMSMGALYGIKPDTLLAAVRPAADPLRWSATASKYRPGDSRGLTCDQWTAFKYVVDGWRASHPNTVQAWWDLQDAVVAAVSDPGTFINLFCGKVRIFCQRNRSFLHIYLPSGRPLSYLRPRVIETETPNGGTRRQVRVEGWDSRLNVWGLVTLYGGLIWENIIQGLCRDLLVFGLLSCERAGYPVVLHVHDEGVFEVPVGEGSAEEVQRLMGVKPGWAGDFPLASAAWRDRRYVK